MGTENETQELYTQIARHILLENTRILAKGIDTLYRSYRQQEKENKKNPWEMDRIAAFVHKTYENSIDRQGDEAAYLAQNPHTDLFRFRKKRPDVPSEGKPTEEDIRLAAMVLMHHELTQLEKQREGEKLFSSYAVLCGCLRDILGFDMCYIAYRYLDDTRILAASAVYHRHLHSMLSEKTMAEVLDAFLRARGGEPDGETVLEKLADNAFLLDGALFPDKDTERKQLLLLPLQLSYGGEGQSEQLFLVFHRASKARESQVLPGLLKRIRDALFLRGRLVSVLNRDFFHLLNTHREYRGISGKSKNAGEIRILHVSDLHVSKDNKEEIGSCIRALERIEEGERKPVDFIAITGDVAQGRCSASDLETNYSCAAWVIRELAFQIWRRPAVARGEDDMVLDQDWKKRVLIIPGNHDYASMNELETQHDETHRASAGGRPAAKEGSTMAKFTYYIDFLRQLLDLDMGSLTDNGLNELRSYNDLHVSFLSLNTSIMANPLRNNKVHLDEEFVRSVGFKLERDIRASNAVVCLCHHGPQYEVDYLSDQYYEGYICAELTKKFGRYVFPRLEILTKRKTEDVSESEMEQAWETVEEIDGDLLKNDSIQTWLAENSALQAAGATVKQILESARDQICAKRQQSRLYADYQYLSEMNKSGPHSQIDERYQSILGTIRRAVKLSENDGASFRKAFQTLQGERRIAVTLSGHTHKRARDDDGCQYVADRFFTQRFQRGEEGPEKLEPYAHLNYGLCTLTTGGQTGVEYRFLSAVFQEMGNNSKVLTHLEQLG